VERVTVVFLQELEQKSVLLRHLRHFWVENDFLLADGLLLPLFATDGSQATCVITHRDTSLGIRSPVLGVADRKILVVLAVGQN
jgi:hypothetical protein